MKKFTLFVLLILLAFTLFGCSGGGSGGSGANTSNALNNRGDGSVSVKINWPQDSKASVLSSAYSVKINICTQVTNATGGTEYLREVNAIVITRNSSNTTENATINGIPIGARVVIVQAYNSSGNEIGYGTQNKTVVTGSNSGVTVTLVSGTFAYTIVGAMDAQVPTSSSGGGGTTTSHYFFVNNYSGGTISVIKQETYSVVGTITVPNTMAQLTKGAFNYNGSYYYVVNSTPNASCIYKVPITNTSNWSANIPTVIYNFLANETAREILYEKTSTGGEYLWVGIQYGTALRQVYIRRISLDDTSVTATGADSFDLAYQYEIVGFIDPTMPNSDGKIIALYYSNQFNIIYATPCYYNGTEFLQPNNIRTGAVTIGGISIGFGPENGTKTAGGFMPSTTAYAPKTNGLSSFVFDNSTNTLATPVAYDSFANGLKLITSGAKYYGINNNALKYANDITAAAGWTTLLTLGTEADPYSISDMAASYNGNYIYVTNFGKGLYPADSRYGNQVYVKTLSNTSSTSPDYTLTVGNNPFSIVAKP